MVTKTRLASWSGTVDHDDMHAKAGQSGHVTSD